MIDVQVIAGYNVHIGARKVKFMTNVYELMEQMEKRIAELPRGYISRKNIQGKTRFYLQWREEGKMKSKYLREDQLEEVKEQIE